MGVPGAGSWAANLSSQQTSLPSWVYRCPDSCLSFRAVHSFVLPGDSTEMTMGWAHAAHNSSKLKCLSAWSSCDISLWSTLLGNGKVHAEGKGNVTVLLGRPHGCNLQASGWVLPVLVEVGTLYYAFLGGWSSCLLHGRRTMDIFFKPNFKKILTLKV